MKKIAIILILLGATVLSGCASDCCGGPGCGGCGSYTVTCCGSSGWY